MLCGKFSYQHQILFPQCGRIYDIALYNQTMMKKILIIITLLYPLISYSQENFNISGKVGFTNAGLAVLNYKIDDISYTDTVKVKTGIYSFKGNTPRLTGASIQILYYAAPGFTNISDILNFYLENKNISIISSDYAKNSKISGSEINEEYAKLKNYIANSSATSSIAISNLYAKYASENITNFMGLVALSNSIVRDVDESTTQVILNKFTPELKSSRLGQNIQSTIQTLQKTKPGNNAIDFIQNDENGKPIKLSDFKGKYVLIDFWASWCNPCRRENPNLVNAYNQFKNKNFTIIGVSLDRNKESWLKAIKDDNLTWTNVSDLKYFDNAVAKSYAIKGTPTNLLIDPEGKIVAKNLFGPQLIQRLNELIKSK